MASRVSSPLLFGLAPRGVFRASCVTTQAVGSYPTFSPLPNDASESKTSRRFFLRDATVLLRRRYILCGTIREPIGRHRPKPMLPRCSPGVTRRVALIRHRLSRACDDGVRTFLPLRYRNAGLKARPTQSEPAITRLTRHFLLYISLLHCAHPDFGLLQPGAEPKNSLLCVSVEPRIS